MPTSWRFLMIVICIFLIASVAIGAVNLLTTPDQILGIGFEGLPKSQFPR
ncbi:MAG: hypothetical protein JJE10_05445 [Thermoleophilia bacterium]|nr:hypothetical protein [Thermoleophilia bacterium]